MTVAELLEKLKTMPPDAIITVNSSSSSDPDYPDLTDAMGEVFLYNEHRSGGHVPNTFPMQWKSVPTGRVCVSIT